jgi:hypothetical protein
MMSHSFTVHCIPWQAGAPLLQEVRMTANEIALFDHSVVCMDESDESSRHAIALSKSGQAIGCARLNPQGQIERITVLPSEHSPQIKAALIEILYEYMLQFNIPIQAETTNR